MLKSYTRLVIVFTILIFNIIMTLECPSADLSLINIAAMAIIAIYL